MNRKRREKLKKIAGGVRNYMLGTWLPNSGNRYSKDLRGWCGHASVILFQRLKKMGMKPKIVGSDIHWFVVCGGFIVDVTASQFGQPDICVRNYSKTQKYIESCKSKYLLSLEKNLDFWEKRDVYNSIAGELKGIALEINNVMRTR